MATDMPTRHHRRLAGRPRLGPGLGDRLPAVRRGGAGARPGRRRPPRRLGRRDARPAIATPSSRAGFRHESIGTRRPAGRRRLGGRRRPRRADGHRPSIQAVLPRRTAFMRNAGADAWPAASPASRSSRRTSTSRSSSRAWTATSTSAASSATSRWRGRGGATPVMVLNKADVAADLDGLARRRRGRRARASRSARSSALTGDGVEALCRRPPRRRAGPRSCSGSSGVGKSTLVNALAGRASASAPARSARTTRAAATRPPTASSSGCPAARCSSTRQASGRSGSPVPPTASTTAFADIAELADGCRFSDCRHEGEPGCAIAAALADGTPRPDRLASHRKLEREAAHVARANDPLLRAEERRKWKAIHVSVNQHMRRKYGDDR